MSTFENYCLLYLERFLCDPCVFASMDDSHPIYSPSIYKWWGSHLRGVGNPPIEIDKVSLEEKEWMNRPLWMDDWIVTNVCIDDSRWFHGCMASSLSPRIDFASTNYGWIGSPDTWFNGTSGWMTVPMVDAYIDNYDPRVAWFHGHLSSHGFALFSLNWCMKVSCWHGMYEFHGRNMVVWISAQ